MRKTWAHTSQDHRSQSCWTVHGFWKHSTSTGWSLNDRPPWGRKIMSAVEFSSLIFPSQFSQILVFDDFFFYFIILFLLLVELFDLIPKPHLLSIRMPRDKMAGCASYDVRVTVPWLQHWCWVSVSRDSLAIGEAVPLLVIHPFFVTLRYILENSAMFLWSRMFWWSRKLETNDCLSCPGPGAFQHTQEEEGRTLEGSLSRPSSASTTVLTGGAPYTKPEVRWGGNKQARTGRHYRKLLLASRLVLVAPADSCQFSGGLAVSAGLCHHGWFMSGTLTLLNWAAGILKMEIKIASKNYF